jgi:hypothetical protein
MAAAVIGGQFAGAGLPRPWFRGSRRPCRERTPAARAEPGRCGVCPRLCKVNRLGDQRGLCAIGRQAVVASHSPHFGEENCLRGRNGFDRTYPLTDAAVAVRLVEEGNPAGKVIVVVELPPPKLPLR